MSLHVRAHEFGPNKPRVRIWTDEMAGYGQFNVVNYDDVESLHQLLGKLGVGAITVHHCDTHEECKCRNISYDESITNYL